MKIYLYIRRLKDFCTLDIELVYYQLNELDIPDRIHDRMELLQETIVN
jgi:hypothetical protein